MAQMIDTNTLADFFLRFSHITFAGSVLALGILAHCFQHRSLSAWIRSRSVWYRVILWCAFSMIVNVALKGTFKMPLPPELGKVGYAFPSGHMQFATVFYGTLALAYRKTWGFFITAVLLIGIGFGLIHFHYHFLIDVIAGFVVGCVLLWIASTMPRERSLWFCATIFMIYSAMMYKVIPKHAIIAFLVLTAFTVLHTFYGKKR